MFCTNCGSRNHFALDCIPVKGLRPGGQLQDPDKVVSEPKVVEQASAKPQPTFESGLRWPGAPPICTAENLPAFELEKDLDVFHLRYGHTTHIEKKWQCKKCGGWHYKATAPSPSANKVERGQYPHLGFKPTI